LFSRPFTGASFPHKQRELSLATAFLCALLLIFRNAYIKLSNSMLLLWHYYNKLFDICKEFLSILFYKKYFARPGPFEGGYAGLHVWTFTP
jgi:hypothetical protein